MKRSVLSAITISSLLLALSACNNENDNSTTTNKDSSSTTTSMKMKEDNVTYSGDNVNMNGYVVYDENKEGVRPAIIVVPEWWGLNDYAKSRARQLAELGYIAMAIDMYGNGKTADSPDSAGALATPFYKNPQMAQARFDAALNKLRSYSQTDTSRIAVFGGILPRFSAIISTS